MEDIKGKKAIVTGSSQGLGRVIAIQLAQAGCEVVVNCANSPEKAQGVVDEIRALGGKADFYRCDITDENAVKKMFEEVGPVDILVNNARLDPYKRKPEYSESKWFMMIMDINLHGAFNCSLAFFNQAKPRNYGRIVNISSVRSFVPAEMTMIAYGVSKLGMHGLTRAFAQNGAAYNITCNTVAPGMIETENAVKRLTPEMRVRELARIPLGRPAESEEIGEAVLFAVRNGYVTGGTININGGIYYEP